MTETAITPYVPGHPKVGSVKRAEIVHRRAQVAKLVLRHTTMIDMAKALKVTTETIRGDLKALRAEWQKEAGIDIKTHQAQLIAELSAIINQCAIRLHDQDRDKSLDSIWIVQWRTTTLERAKVLGIINNHIDLPGGARIGIREVVIELPSDTL